MFVLFQDARKFLAGRALSENDASAPGGPGSGQRVTVKAGHNLP